ncbi:hypothetical protein F4604DRAFT_1673517 [Suillus subluteus]|nr:hypothetical protein F4604DRAFT_1673517 [Suillus subluteus]
MNPVPADWAVATTHIATWYADALQMMEKGIKPDREENLLAQYPPDREILLDRPAVVCDKFGVIVLWYLPGAIDLAIQNDMAAATAKMAVILAKSVMCSAETNVKMALPLGVLIYRRHGFCKAIR